MACIATETGGAKAILTNNFNGILVPIEGTENKINAIVRLLSDLNLQNRISTNAKITVHTIYNKKIIMKDLINLIFDN
jgi:glycosyltransferase involved in cell wall biosynthesis